MMFVNKCKNNHRLDIYTNYTLYVTTPCTIKTGRRVFLIAKGSAQHKLKPNTQPLP